MTERERLIDILGSYWLHDIGDAADEILAAGPWGIPTEGPGFEARMNKAKQAYMGHNRLRAAILAFLGEPT